MRRARAVPLALLLAALLLAALLSPAPSGAAGITIQSFSSMSAFQSSPLYAHITGGVGTLERKARGVRAVRQGPSDVPAASAGAANNTTVSAEVANAAKDVPDVFSLNSSSSSYDKKFVSLGTNSNGSLPPYITLDLTPVATEQDGGFQGYDIVVFDLGKNLASGTGNSNTEATSFQVELVSEGVFYEVGSITATTGNFINAILLDVTGLPGVPAEIDAVRITDVSGGGVSASGGLDVDGALTLNVYTPVPALASTWGAVKAAYRR
jgi:hypothetical protein